jgi:hypothetical protein
MSTKQPWILVRRVLFLLLCFLVLTGVGPCHNFYHESRFCGFFLDPTPNLSMDINIGQPGVLVPSCLAMLPESHPHFILGDTIEITLEEKISIISVPPSLTAEIVNLRQSRMIRITPNVFAIPGSETVVMTTKPHAGRVLIEPQLYTITVNIHGITPSPSPPPTPIPSSTPSPVPSSSPTPVPTTPPASLGVSANPDLVGTGGSLTLSAAVSGGTGPFIYNWRGYRDDGVPGGALTLSSNCDATPQTTLLQPDWDFIFFATVLDKGRCTLYVPGVDVIPIGSTTWVAPSCPPDRPDQEAYYCSAPDAVLTGFVRVHESDGPVASFTVAPGPFHAGVDSVFFNDSSSTNVAVPVSWGIQYAGNVFPAGLDPGIEDFMLLPFGSWSTVYSVDTNPLSMTAPATAFAQPGAYRAQLMVTDDNFNSHVATQYFVVQP